MLHPVYSKVLLEATSSAGHIVKFKGDYFLCDLWIFSNIVTIDRRTLSFFCLHLSHAAGARPPRCLRSADGSWGGGSRRHRSPQQVEAEAGCPSKQSAPYRNGRKS